MKVMQNPMIRWQGDLSTLPKVSIVTPCFNHVDFIEATILSILGQGYPNLEYVVMDGGSTDGSVEIIATYTDYLTYWRTHSDGGQYEAISEGFRHTSGDIMAWLNSDDMLHRNALWTVVAVFQQFPQVEWLMGNPSCFDAQGRIVSTNRVPRWSRYRLLHGEHQWIQQESVFWRRSLWEKAGGYLDTSYHYAADFELWLRFSRYARLYTTTALLAGFRFSSPEQKSAKYMTSYLQEVKQILRNEPQTFDDKIVLSKIKRFSYLMRVPLLRRRLKRIYVSLFQYPPIISYDPQLDAFELR